VYIFSNGFDVTFGYCLSIFPCAVEDEQFSAQTHDFVNAKDYFGRYGTFLCLCPVMTYGLFSTVE